MEWLSFGAQSVDWWDVHNYGTPTADFGLLSSGTSGEPAVNTPYAPVLRLPAGVEARREGRQGRHAGRGDAEHLRLLLQPARLRTTRSMLVNADPTNAYTVSTSSLGITGSAQTEYVYSAANPAIATSSLSRHVRTDSGGVDRRADQRQRAPRRPTPTHHRPPTTPHHRPRAPPTTPPPTTPPPTTPPLQPRPGHRRLRRRRSGNERPAPRRTASRTHGRRVRRDGQRRRPAAPRSTDGRSR